ncbi:MAG: hypothetical protein IJ538_03370 [Clostridia bacterium]|nr:hypothetical protein [Clostridia bacterium]
MKKSKAGIFWKIFITVSVIVAIFLGGYFFIDKSLVPKYFGQYGINSVPDLVNVVTSLYNNPKESKIITNSYTEYDLNSSIAKLKASGYKIEDDGTVDKSNYSEFKGYGTIELSDKEFAAICNKMLKSGMLADAVPNLNYLNVTEDMTLLEVIVTPKESSKKTDGTYTAANISFMIKLDTEAVREQIAEQMATPLYLLKIIIPDQMYFKISYDFDLDETDENRSNGQISVNGKKASQSEYLLNILVDFIFPKEDEMTLEKFTNEVGNIALKGIDALGDFKFLSEIDGKKQNGFLIDSGVEAPETDPLETDPE